MKHITLKVSGLTWAVVRNRYPGDGPIKLDRNDLLRREMMVVGTSNLHLERKQYSLTHELTFLVNKQQYDHMIGKRPEIAFYLYAQEKYRMSAFVWARVTAGLHATDALKDYYLLRGITDDEHDIETAERQWKRWHADSEKERNTEAPQSVPPPCCVLLSERQAKSLYERMKLMITNHSITMDPRYLPAIEAWIYSDLTPMSFREVAERLNRRKGNVGTSVRRLREYMTFNADLRTLASYCLKQTQAQPTPSAAS